MSTWRLSLRFAWPFALPLGLACTVIDNPNLAETTDSENTETTVGDGDGDPTTTGDGDGEPTTTGDGDGDPTTTGDGDGDGDDNSCDIWLQDCDDGEKCMPIASDGETYDKNECVPIQGDGFAGDPCTLDNPMLGTDDCGDGFYCWAADFGDVGVCTPLCAGSPDDPNCGPATSCLIQDDGLLPICATTCDPLLQDCGADLGCYNAQTLFVCVYTTQDIPVGEPCGSINDCIVGAICVDASFMPDCMGEGCCSAMCDLSDPVCQQGGTECTSWYREGQAPPGYEDVGVCILPGA